MKLSELEDEKAIQTVGELVEPLTAICMDEKFQKFYKAKPTTLETVSYMCKNHAKQVMACLAIIDGVPVEEYHCNILTLPMKLLELAKDEGVQQLFTSAETEKDA